MGGGLAFWGNELGVKVDGRSALLWGFAARVSSSEELSSEAPRMNLRRSLASDLELSIGTLSLKIFWLLSGKGGSSVFSLDKVCLCSVSAVLTFGETLLPGDRSTAKLTVWRGRRNSWPWSVHSSCRRTTARQGFLFSFRHYSVQLNIHPKSKTCSI